MPVPTKLAGFGVVLIAAFGAAFGVGRAVGSDGPDPTRAPAATTTSAPGHGSHP